MIIRFHETFALPAADVYAYFRTPADWVRLYGFAGQVEDRGGGWYAVPLRGFPFPLVARITDDDPPRRVTWRFRGFWRGDGEVRIEEVVGGVVVEGHEDISVRWLGIFSPLVERPLFERQFRRIWQLGWDRLRKHEPAVRAPASVLMEPR